MMEIREVHNNDPIVKEVRLMQVSVILDSLAFLTGTKEDVIINMFKEVLDKEMEGWNKEVRVIEGDEILNSLFNEKNS
jgi:molybdopterin biosynthesis enzyme MoaB